MSQLGKNIRILNLDDSITSQKNLIAKFNNPPYTCEIIDLKKEAPYLRYWAKREDLNRLAQKLGPSKEEVVTLYGSGDFHHISATLIENFKQPLCVLVFDHHPDWDSLGPPFSCGSWVRAVVDNDNVKKIILLGPSSEDLSAQGLLTASFTGLEYKKLKIFPYERKPSRLFFRNLKEANCFKLLRRPFISKIEWDNLAKKEMNEFLTGLLLRLPYDDVYISIDKDCLRDDYAITNWEQGNITVGWLLEVLNIIKLKKNIVGVDITGDYSPPVMKGWVKNFMSFLDHPRKNILAEDTQKITCINEDTNLKILNVFSQAS